MLTRGVQLEPTHVRYHPSYSARTFQLAYRCLSGAVDLSNPPKLERGAFKVEQAPEVPLLKCTYSSDTFASLGPYYLPGGRGVSNWVTQCIHVLTFNQNFIILAKY